MLALMAPQHNCKGVEEDNGRGDWTRTSDLHVPNVARYQLRYTPILIP